MLHILLMASRLMVGGESTLHPAAVLWQEPEPKTVADWIWGPGGQLRAPRPPFQFVRENLGGTNPKIEVNDAVGARWVVKFGGEVHTETFAARFLFALGYLSQPTYFIPEGHVNGVRGLKRAKPFVDKVGNFRAARFQLHDERGLTFEKDLNWSWTKNPFTGTHELNALKIVMMLLSNWDAKDARDGGGSNTAVFTRDTTRYYAFTDWGATLGSWGGVLRHDRWDLGAYERQTRSFVEGLHSGAVVWGYRGKHNTDLTQAISSEDVRWLLPHLRAITSEELRTGLIASGATEMNAKGFTRCIQERIKQLERLAAPAK
jgi:hypothetical protein